MAAEAAAISVCGRRLGRGIALVRIAPTLVSGACLLLALRFALTGAPWPWIGASLLAALAAHLADLWGRARLDPL